MNWFKSYVFASYWWSSNFAGGDQGGAPPVVPADDNWLIRARRRGRR